MTFHNLSQVRWFNLAMGLAFGLPFLWLLFWERVPLPFQWRVTLLVAYLVLLLGLVYICKPAYCYFEVGERKLVAKYYYLIPLFFMRAQRSTIEILKGDFKDYELISGNYGLTQELLLSVRQSARVLPYPPVSVVLVPGRDLARLAEQLDKFRA
jgi:hypothetical protein